MSSDQVYTQQANGAFLSQFPVMHLHPDSINTLVSKQRSNTNTVQTNPGNPLDVAVSNFTIPDANSLNTSYSFADSVPFLFSENVTNGWSIFLDFSRKSGTRPTNVLGFTTDVSTSYVNTRRLNRTNVLDLVRIQSLEIVSSLPLQNPLQCYFLAVYELNLPAEYPAPYLFDPTHVSPTFWLSLDGSSATAYTANRQLVIPPDPIGLSLSLSGNQAIFVLCGPYNITDCAPPSDSVAIVLAPETVTLPVVGELPVGGIMNLRYVSQWGSSSTRSNLGFVSKRPTLL
jgi:hypothetical protein